MTQQYKKEVKVVEKSKTVQLSIHEIEENSVIVNVDGWRVRLYFDKNMAKEKKSGFRVGQTIDANYFGNIEDVHSLKFTTIK